MPLLGADTLINGGALTVGENVTIEVVQDSSHAVETQKFWQS